MANKLYEESDIQSIASAIRTKNETQNTYTVNQMANAILDLPTGGGSVIVPNGTKFAGSTWHSVPSEFDLSGLTDADFYFLFQYCGLVTCSLDLKNAYQAMGTFDGCYGLTSVTLTGTSNLWNMKYFFRNCGSLVTTPSFNDSNLQDVTSMFQGCSSLENVIVYNASKLVYMDNMFSGCGNLTTTSLDNILQMCINTTSRLRSTKTLSMLGLTDTDYPAATITALPHYQDFVDAGWTIGYN